MEKSKNSSPQKKLTFILCAAVLCFCFVVTGCGKRDGVHKIKYNSGVTKEETYYVAGVPQGQSILYHENGKVKEELQYVKGKKEGKSKVYYDDGRLEAELNYRNDKVHGMVREYHPNKRVKTVLIYNNGKLAGQSKWYFPDGKIEATKEYKNGYLDGETKVYDQRTGTVAYSEVYEKNKKVKRTEYDIDPIVRNTAGLSLTSEGSSAKPGPVLQGRKPHMLGTKLSTMATPCTANTPRITVLRIACVARSRRATTTTSGPTSNRPHMK